VYIVIEELRDEPLHVRHTYAPADLPFRDEGAVLSTPVLIEFVLTHKKQDLHLDGSVQTGIGCKCSRCLKEFEVPLHTRFDVFYLPQPKWLKDQEIELKYEEMDIGYYDGARLDVDQLTVEQIELALPMKFICSESCKGLCYNCGADLNQGVCLCDRDQTDHRLAVLLDFRNKMKDRR
jgi:uncharacterized protein